jgi:hypothetical protein
MLPLLSVRSVYRYLGEAPLPRGLGNGVQSNPVLRYHLTVRIRLRRQRWWLR